MRTVTVNERTVAPGKIVCVGRNYVAHIEELGNEIPSDMVVFNKPNSAIGDQLVAARDGEPLHYEGEIALAIEGGSVVAVGFGLDLTRRALQTRLKQQGLPWERAKAFDGAALFSAFVPFDGPMGDLSLRLSIDDELRQAGGVPQMMYPPAVILEELARYTTLDDGDIVMTGTPAGVGEVVAGQRFLGEVFCGDARLTAADWTAE